MNAMEMFLDSWKEIFRVLALVKTLPFNEESPASDACCKGKQSRAKKIGFGNNKNCQKNVCTRAQTIQ